MSKEVYIVSAARTPIGSLMGSLSALPAHKLGSVVIKAALERSGLSADAVNEVIMGNVLQANVGQAPARQASRGAGLPDNVVATTINKVCASGMKSVMYGAQSILLGDSDVVIAGGMESMSNAPYYLANARGGYRMGNGEVIDGMIRDGLWDPYNNQHMGMCGELCATEKGITREQQDAFAIESYKRAQAAQAAGLFKDEIAAVEIAGPKGSVLVEADEEPGKTNFDKIPQLRPAFKKDGTVTAANASKINDGAAALLLASKEAVEKYGLKPIGRIVASADAEQDPVWFTTTPSLAMPKALAKAGLTVDQIDAFEINEAFAVVTMANSTILGLDPAKVDVNGGAISLGHPIGASGARILVTLLSVLKQKGGRYGLAGICNGGGGASAVVIERL
jgi:acetyl-CoA C-acetyltransferase